MRCVLHLHRDGVQHTTNMVLDQPHQTPVDSVEENKRLSHRHHVADYSMRVIVEASSRVLLLYVQHVN